MKDNKKIIIIMAVVLTLILINVYSITSKLFEQLSHANGQLSNLQYQLDNMKSDFQNLQGNIEQELKSQSSILSSYNISYDNGDAKTLMGDIIIELVPKEYSDSTSATITLGDKLLPMNREGNTFAAVISVPVDIIYSQFIVDFKEGEEIRSEVVAPGDIGFVNVLVNEVDASFLGEMTTYDADENYSYRGPVQIYTSEKENSYSDIKLLAIKNNKVVWETKDFTYDRNTESFTANIDETFTLKKEDKLHLALDITDSYGFKYKTPLYETEIHGSDGITGASEAMDAMVYDAEGKVIEFKNY